MMSSNNRHCNTMPEIDLASLVGNMGLQSNWQALAEQIIQNFQRIRKKGKFKILTKGIQADNPEYYHSNKKLSLAVQSFILKTKRFQN